MARIISFLRRRGETRNGKMQPLPKSVRFKSRLISRKTISFAILTLIVFLFFSEIRYQQDEPETYSSERFSRVLSASASCVPASSPTVSNSSSSVTTDSSSTETPAMAIVYFLGVLYCFLALAIICDEYFEPCLQAISTKLGLSDDVAGATFMAAGSSAPELFTSVMSAFFKENSSLGIGTIVGSAMFNILVIVAMSAAVTSGSVKIDWRPVVRDVSFYLLSIGLLVYAITAGSEAVDLSAEGSNSTTTDATATSTIVKVPWYQGLIMVIAYCFYILFMYFNETIMDKCKSSRSIQVFDVQEENIKAVENDDDDDDDGLWYVPPEGFVAKIYWTVSLPLVLAFKFTIPNIEKGMFKDWAMLGFSMSIIWIAVACYIMVDFAVEIGCLLGIPEVVMGVVLLAAGTSVPDMIASIIVARQGQADMAIANAVGSNVFDILLGLGLPWCLAPPIRGIDTYVNTKGIVENVVILLSTVIIYLVVIILNRWKINTTIGIVFTGLYIVYIVMTLVLKDDLA